MIAVIANEQGVVNITGNSLGDRLERFGFRVKDIWEGWSQPIIENLTVKVDSWERDKVAIAIGDLRLEDDRQYVPSMLKNYDNPSPYETIRVSFEGRTVAEMPNTSSLRNPYPLGSDLAVIWSESFESNKKKTEESAEVAKEESPEETIEDVNAEADGEHAEWGDPEQHTEVDSVEPDSQADDFPSDQPDANNQPDLPPQDDAAIDILISSAEQQKIAILELQATIEAVLQRQLYLKDAWESQKEATSAARKRYVESIEEGHEVFQKLKDVRAGKVPKQKRLDFDGDDEGNDGNDRKSRRTSRKEDIGGGMPISSLGRKKLAELTGCDKSFGLTPKQIENLEDAVSGSTIRHLETFQREVFGWEGKVKRFGESGITALQDAHAELRKKFPIPGGDEGGDSEVEDDGDLLGEDGDENES